MKTQFYCKTEWRRKAVEAHGFLNGIDYLEVSDDQKTLLVHFIKPLANEPSKENVGIDGGVRITHIDVKNVSLIESNIMKVVIDQPGDFSMYTLRFLPPVSSTIKFTAFQTDPTIEELGLKNPSQIRGALSDTLSGYAGLTNDPAKIKIEIGSKGPYEIEISGKPSTLDDLRAALEAGIQAAHTSPAFKNASVLKMGTSLLVLPGIPGRAITFTSAGDDPGIKELGLKNPRQIEGVLSDNLPVFTGLSKDPAKIEMMIGSKGPYEMKIVGRPSTLGAVRSKLETAVRKNSPGARVLLFDDHLLVFPGKDWFDPALLAIEFNFKVSCPSDFDCKLAVECPPRELTEPEINYLAKDYASFRRLMLDRLSVIMPDWRERNAADLQIALVELLAYIGDHLSYFQDAVATEAYLGTARKRISVRRHARLLDYPMHDGCNARAWVCIEVKKKGGADGQPLPKGTPLLTKGSDDNTVVAKTDLEKVLQEEKPIVFETMHDVSLHSSQNEIHFYTWSDTECCLPKGSTRATLRNDPPLFLESGDVLIFEEICSSTKGTEADKDLTHRHAVRLKEVTPSQDPLDGTKVVEIEWYERDALPFPLCISAQVTHPDGTQNVKEIGVARGNAVLVDHGQTLTDTDDNGEKLLIPEKVSSEGYYHPKLRHTGISFSTQYDHESAKEEDALVVFEQDPHKALPSRMSLKDVAETWTVQRDLLGSDRFKTDFVVEIEQNGEAYLRFGDDVLGKKPSRGTTFATTYRVGNGRVGNVGAEVIARIVSDVKDIVGIRNPLPAIGGTDAETMEQVRQFAPHAFRTQERAVTEADFAEVTQRHPEVQKATARFRWTGSWITVFVTIDRKGGWEVDAEFRAVIRNHLEKYRLAGYDIEINGPVFVPLEIQMMVCVKPGYFKSGVKESLIEVFSTRDLGSGQRGFFHPDNFTFGQPVYLSQVYHCAMNVAGVASVTLIKFHRWGKTPKNEIENGLIKPDALEVIRLDNDPNFPENGKIDFEMQGGL